jgi:hypothetical protein
MDDNASHNNDTVGALRTELLEKTKIIDSVTLLCQGCLQPLHQIQQLVTVMPCNHFGHANCFPVTNNPERCSRCSAEYLHIHYLTNSLPTGRFANVSKYLLDLEINNYEKRAEILKLQQRLNEANDIIKKIQDVIPMINVKTRPFERLYARMIA